MKRLRTRMRIWEIALAASGLLALPTGSAFADSLTATASPHGLDFGFACAGVSCTATSGTTSKDLVYFEVSYPVSEPKLTDPSQKCSLSSVTFIADGAAVGLSAMDHDSSPSLSRSIGQPAGTSVTAKLKFHITQQELLKHLPFDLKDLSTALQARPNDDRYTLVAPPVKTLNFDVGLTCGGLVKPSHSASIAFTINGTRIGKALAYPKDPKTTMYTGNSATQLSRFGAVAGLPSSPFSPKTAPAAAPVYSVPHSSLQTGAIAQIGVKSQTSTKASPAAFPMAKTFSLNFNITCNVNEFGGASASATHPFSGTITTNASGMAISGHLNAGIFSDEAFYLTSPDQENSWDVVFVSDGATSPLPKLLVKINVGLRVGPPKLGSRPTPYKLQFTLTPNNSDFTSLSGSANLLGFTGGSCGSSDVTATAR